MEFTNNDLQRHLDSLKTDEIINAVMCIHKTPENAALRVVNNYSENTIKSYVANSDVSECEQITEKLLVWVSLRRLESELLKRKYMYD